MYRECRRSRRECRRSRREISTNGQSGDGGCSIFKLCFFTCYASGAEGARELAEVWRQGMNCRHRRRESSAHSKSGNSESSLVLMQEVRAGLKWVEAVAILLYFSEDLCI